MGQRFQRSRHAHQHPRRADPTAERRNFRTGLIEELVPDCHVATNCVGIIELIGVIRFWLLAQLPRRVNHGAEELWSELPVFRRNNPQVRAENPHGLQLFFRKPIRRNRHEPIALDRAHERQRTASTSARVLNNAHSRA